MTEAAHALDDSAKPPGPNTFSSIRLDPQELAALTFDKFVRVLLSKLDHVKTERLLFYENLRRTNSLWANGGRAVLAILGAFALFLTALAAAIRLAPKSLPFAVKDGSTADQGVLVTILIIYALMGAIGFYEKGSDRTSSYFRQIASILAIRDLWTKFQFDLVKELLPIKVTTDPSTTDPARLRILTIGQALVTDIDKVATGELTEFRTEFLASLAELDAAAKKGSEEITKILDDRLKAAEKEATDARAAIKAAEDARKPGFVNLSVTGEFDSELVVFVSGNEAARSSGKTVALDGRLPGPTKIEVRAKKGTKDLNASQNVDVKPGIQNVTLALT
jgi:hypothetical protein